jgi:hypothetical protein
VSSLRCGKLQSFFSKAIAPNTFLREVPLTRAVSSSAMGRQTRTYLVRIPRRKDHSIQSIVRLAWRSLAGAPHPRSDLELAPTGGISSCMATRIEQPAESLLVVPPSCLRRFRKVLVPCYNCTRPGRGIGLCCGSNPSAVPGAKTEWGGTRPPSSIRDWQQSAKSVSPSVMRPQWLGTRRKTFVCSTCAR